MPKLSLHSQTRSVFKASPSPSLLLNIDPEFTVAEVSHTFLEVIGSKEKEVVGKGIFEVFSEIQDHKHILPVEVLKRALEKVLDTKKPQRMTPLKYDIVDNRAAEVGQGMDVPVIIPVLDDEGDIDFLYCTVTNPAVSEFSNGMDGAANREQSPGPVQKLAEEEKNEVLRMLQERIKEQSCLYRISSLNEQKLVIDELLNEAAAILPTGWQYSDIVEAAIEYDGKTYQTPRYRETRWMMSARTEIRENCFLVAKVVYLEERPERDEGPFLEEERNLIDSVINHLSLKIDQMLSQQELKEKQQLLDKAYQLARIGTWEFNMQTHELYWSPVTKEVHGFDQDYEPDLESTIKLFKEGENREIFEKAAWDAIEHEKPFDVELKIVSGQGDERWIRATGEPEYKDGVCTRFYGIS